MIDERVDWNTLSITTDPHIDIREDLFGLVQTEKWTIRELASRTHSLEDAFVDILQQSPGSTGESAPPAEPPRKNTEDDATPNPVESGT